MIRLKLLRGPSTSDGTFGSITLPSGVTIRTGELPWVDKNQDGIGDPQLSCVTPGPDATESIVYLCKWQDSPKHGMCYHLQNVVQRKYIEIHSANFMGSVEDDKDCQLLGCVAPGMTVGTMKNSKGAQQMAVLRSRDALTLLLAAVAENGAQADFELEIVPAELD